MKEEEEEIIRNLESKKKKKCGIGIKEKLHKIHIWLKRDLVNWKMVLRHSSGASERV